MKQPFLTAVLACMLATVAAVNAAFVSADVSRDCRQEAQEYGIHEEALDDYIEGCLASRGGLVADDDAGMDYVPPAETDDPPELLTGDTDAAR